MSPKPCIYKCGTILDGWDDDARRYKEAGTGYLHTKERCQEVKLKKEQKDDHGNEGFGESRFSTAKGTGSEEVIKGEYVDHTAKGQSKVRIFEDKNLTVVEELYNRFLTENQGKIKTQGAQFQMTVDTMAIALYYEEVTK